MKTKCLLYCTKAKPDLWSYESYYGSELVVKYGINMPKEHIKYIGLDKLNGTIVAECEVECEEITYHKPYADDEWDYDCYTDTLSFASLVRLSRVSYVQFHDYLKGNNGYALHISNLKIFDEPLSMFEVSKEPKLIVKNYIPKKLSAPRNMMRVWWNGEQYILISIRPEYACKILNGEKTIEIRKQVLKEMK